MMDPFDQLIKSRFLEMKKRATSSVKLGNLISPYKATKCGDKDYPVLSITRWEGLILQSDRFKKEIASKDKSQYKVIPRNKLVVAFPIDEGLVCTQTIVDKGIVSPAYEVYSIDDKLVEPLVLQYYLRSDSAIQYYLSKLRGTTLRRRTIPRDDFYDMDIKLPDLNEQKAFISFIKQVDKSKSIYKQLVSKYDDLVKSRFIEMFGNIIDNTKGLKLTPINHLCLMKAGKAVYSQELYDQPSDGLFPCYGGNGIRGYIAKYSHEGTYPIVGRQGALCGNVNLASGQFYATEHAVVVTPIESMNPIWLYYVLKELKLDRFATASAQPGLSVGKVEKTMMPEVDRTQQNEFADFVQQVDKSKLILQQDLVARLQSL